MIGFHFSTHVVAAAYLKKPQESDYYLDWCLDLSFYYEACFANLQIENQQFMFNPNLKFINKHRENTTELVGNTHIKPNIRDMKPGCKFM